MNEKNISIPASRLVFALDYIEFLDRSWSQVRRNEWGFADLRSDLNPHGFSAERAPAVLRRFNLRWAPPMSQAFFAPRLHEVLRAAVAQKAEFQVPIEELINDLSDATCMVTTARPVFDASGIDGRTTYSYRGALRNFFAAFACGEIGIRDLRRHMSI